MAYEPEIMFIALVKHQVIDGGTEDSVTNFGQELFAKFDEHIVEAASQAGIILDEKQRSIVAAVATIVPGGSAQECAETAVEAFIDLFAN